MRDDTLVVVHCYEGDKAMVEGFMPVWTHHNHPVLLLSPEDAPVNISIPDWQVSSASAGERGWKGPQTIRRQMAHWRLALEHPSQAQWFFLNDADSMCLSAEIPRYVYADPFKLWCNVLCHENEHRLDDHPNLNPPYFMSRDVLQAILDKAEAMVDEIPQDAFLEPHDWGQAIDGFYTHVVSDELGIPYGDFPDGITTWPRGRPDLLKYTERGAVFIHGVKTGIDLNLLLLNHKAWRISNAPLPMDAHGMYEGESVTVEM